MASQRLAACAGAPPPRGVIVPVSLGVAWPSTRWGTRTRELCLVPLFHVCLHAMGVLHPVTLSGPKKTSSRRLETIFVYEAKVRSSLKILRKLSRCVTGKVTVE